MIVQYKHWRSLWLFIVRINQIERLHCIRTVAGTSKNKTLSNAAVALWAGRVAKNGTANCMSQRMILINSWVCAFGHSIYAMCAINNMNNRAVMGSSRDRHVISAVAAYS